MNESIVHPHSVADPDYPSMRSHLPTGQLVLPKHRVRFASGLSDLLRVQRLRYRVFNEAMKVGFSHSIDTGLDQDDYDGHCHHLMVEEAGSGILVATLRLLTNAGARRAGGFYSSTEYDVAALPEDALERGLEMGRLCALGMGKSPLVVSALWQGVLRYARQNDCEYLFGCASIPTLDPGVSWGYFDRFVQDGVLSPDLCVRPLRALRYDPASRSTEVEVSLRKLPPLFRYSLSFGANVVSEPARDDAFRVTDFMLLAKLSEARPRFQRRMDDRPSAWN